MILQDTDLLHLSEVERKVLQKVAIAKLQALNLGVCVKVPTGKSQSSFPMNSFSKFVYSRRKHWSNPHKEAKAVSAEAEGFDYRNLR